MNKSLITFVAIFSFFLGNVFADIFSEFEVTGNQRVSTQTIINFSKLKKRC